MAREPNSVDRSRQNQQQVVATATRFLRDQKTNFPDHSTSRANLVKIGLVDVEKNGLTEIVNLK